MDVTELREMLNRHYEEPPSTLSEEAKRIIDEHPVECDVLPKQEDFMMHLDLNVLLQHFQPPPPPTKPIMQIEISPETWSLTHFPCEAKSS